MKIILNGVGHILCPTLAKRKGTNDSSFAAYWNCGWHCHGKVFGHSEFRQLFERLTTEEAKHQADPIEGEGRWRRSIDHIWYEHEVWGKVICRVDDGRIARICSRFDDHFLACVPMSELKEVPRFESCNQPAYLTRCVAKTKPKTKSKKRRKPLDINDFI